MIAILGGGISGLTLAWHLQKAGVAYHLFEAGDRPGGNLRSELVDGYLLETGPNSVQLSPELEELLADLELTEQLQDTAAVSANRYVLRDGRYRRLPDKPQQLLFSSFFSLKARYAILRELTRPTAPPDELETLAGFFRRRFDQEIVDYALNPFISGIYAGDPEQLLLHKTFPKLAALEQTYGSVLRGLAKSGGAGQRRRIVSLRGGLHTLTHALAARLTHYRGGQRLTGLARLPDGRYQLQTAAGPLPDLYDAVALGPACLRRRRAAAGVVSGAGGGAGGGAVPGHERHLYTAYPRAAVAHPLDGFGALHPKVENCYAAGSVWTSSLFPDRAPAGQVLFTTFVGGTQYAAQAHDPAATQKAAVDQELRRLYGITATQPSWQFRYHWEKAIPQFDAHIVGAHAAAATLTTHGIHTTANWLAGVGVPDCIRHAKKVSDEMVNL